MLNKKFFLRAAAFALLAIAPVTDSKAEDYDDYEDSAFYGRAGYNGTAVWSFEVEGAKAATFSTKPDFDGAKKYEPNFAFGKFGGSIAFGKSFGDMRAEIEGVISGKITPEKTTEEFFVNTGSASTYTPRQVDFNGFSHISGMVNAYYDLPLNDVLVPYAGGGLGVSRVTFSAKKDVSAYAIALQGKLGASFTINKSFVPYVGYRALYLMNKEFPEITAGTGTNYKPQVSSLLHNIEAGIMLSLGA